MSAINLTAALPFFTTIAEKYDAGFLKEALSEFRPEEESLAPFVPKINEYNRAATMSRWYTVMDATSLLSPADFIFPGAMEQRKIDRVAMQWSASCHLRTMGEEPESIIPRELIDFFPVLSVIASPKSELDSLIFRKVYCNASDSDRDRIIQEMETACAGLDAKFLNGDQLIYRIQGIVAFIFRSEVVKGIAFIGILTISQVIFNQTVTKISFLFIKYVVPKWEDALNTHSHFYGVLELTRVYHALKSANAYFTPIRKLYLNGGIRICSPLLYACASQLPQHHLREWSFKLLGIISHAPYLIFPTDYFYGLFGPLSARFIKTALVTFKIFSGTEYKTVEAIEEQFKNKPLYYQKGLKAHALWMRLMRKSRPEEIFVSLGSLAPSAA